MEQEEERKESYHVELVCVCFLQRVMGDPREWQGVVGREGEGHGHMILEKFRGQLVATR